MSANLMALIKRTALIVYVADIFNCSRHRGAFLDTFSFQARPFYERHGYECFGELRDHPPGHSHYFMRKLFKR